ncbi:MAG: HEAT repeat domain-containing protein [Verrucomicrobiae bacterium]|nr:HEAT repeat domain-containing protein [Verrucomicrobiae bacterium]
MNARIDAKPLRIVLVGALLWLFFLTPVLEAQSNRKPARNRPNRNQASRDPLFEQYALYRKNAPRAEEAEQPRTVSLPLELEKGAHIAFIGNTLFERAGQFGFFEAMLHAQFPKHALTVRNLSWSADTPDLQPRPSNFADVEQHLFREQADVIFAAFGFNESFDGEGGTEAFRNSLREFSSRLQSLAFNGRTGPEIILVSPIACENIKGVSADDMNHERLLAYTQVMEEVAGELNIGFANVLATSRAWLSDTKTDYTINGVHLTEQGYARFASDLFNAVFDEESPNVSEKLREAVVEKSKQYFQRYRPLNTYYYTGARNKTYGYLDFLPAMRNFDIMVSNRDEWIWELAQGNLQATLDDSNIPAMPQTPQSRGANRWLSSEDELSEFKIDPRFEVNLFASEEQFPDLACPIQMRWDARGRLWVSCSTTYPHVYPGNEPGDKIIILEDIDKDGRADKSTVFADDLHIPLSFELGDGGVYVSEEPFMSWIGDTDGDGKADKRVRLLAGFGSEDSHHALHDFVWTPEGDLLFRESIFHHSQIETPYGPVRADNSAWFQFRPDNHRLTSFGSYPNTNPWGVTFDDWGYHVASHPVFASAFHALNPPYPQQHPRAAGLPAYSGVCGHEFVDFDFWPEEMQGGFVKVRYKPSNRVEIHQWIEKEDHFEESYQGDIIYSSNLSFIPVDLRFGPRGAMYVCDWYNPVKGHAQYSLRDERRDRRAGRIWRIVPKGATLQDPPLIHDQPIASLLDVLKRPEYRYRYWTRNELRSRSEQDVFEALTSWLNSLDRADPRFRHHQVEALWLYRNIGATNHDLLRKLIQCEEHHARAAAVRVLRSWYGEMPDAHDLLAKAVSDENPLVRLESAIAASWFGTQEALDVLLRVADQPLGDHLRYAFVCSLGSENMRRHWEGNTRYALVPVMLRDARKVESFLEPPGSAKDAEFDLQKDLVTLRIACIPEQMRFTEEKVSVRAGQPVKLIFTNPDATDHNWVLVQPGSMEELGMAANEMVKNPKNARSDFIPKDPDRHILQYTPLIGPSRDSKVEVLRFIAPEEPGIYPYLCTFPGHWVVMNGALWVTNDEVSEEDLQHNLSTPIFVKEWQMADFEAIQVSKDEHAIMRGMKSFLDAQCHQCHQMDGRGIELGPDLSNVSERFRGKDLLQQILKPSSHIDEPYRLVRVETKEGEEWSGNLVDENEERIRLRPSLFAPDELLSLRKKQIKTREISAVSPMPEGMLSTMDRQAILDLLAYLEAGGHAGHQKH